MTRCVGNWCRRSRDTRPATSGVAEDVELGGPDAGTLRRTGVLSPTASFDDERGAIASGVSGRLFPPPMATSSTPGMVWTRRTTSRRNASSFPPNDSGRWGDRWGQASRFARRALRGIEAGLTCRTRQSCAAASRRRLIDKRSAIRRRRECAICGCCCGWKLSHGYLRGDSRLDWRWKLAAPARGQQDSGGDGEKEGKQQDAGADVDFAEARHIGGG